MRQYSTIEGSLSGTNINDSSSYQRSLSVDDSTIDDELLRKTRAFSVEPNLKDSNDDIKINNGHNHPCLYQQRSLPNGSKISGDKNSVKMNRHFTSSEAIDQSV